MQAHLQVGPVPTASSSPHFSDAILFPSSSSLFTSIAAPSWSSSSWHHHRRRCLVVASSSRYSINGHRDYYSVLAVERNASPADIKRAYRLLARQYHPDVSKHAQAGEMFKSIRRAYETLSNEAKRTQYDRELRLQEDRGRVDRRKQQYYSHQFVDEERLYRWAEAKRRRMAYYDVEEEDEEDDSDDETTMAEEGSLDQERAPFVQKLDAGYKTGHLIAWILGGRNGVMLTLCIQFTSWVCGKTSSSMVTLMVVAMWIVSNLARYAPLPTGAVLTLLHMSMKLQVDLT
ncbi:Chaperone protein dnaJ A6, chloroplastic [Linum grandiflorum]